MRHTIFALACAVVLMSGVSSAMADSNAPTALLNKQELQTIQQQQLQPVAPAPADQTTVLVAAPPPPPWSGYATREFGPQYRSIVPMEIKSDNPGIVRTWDPNAHPGNGSQLTPEGMACASDADCERPLGCFSRADSGMVPERLCAVPPLN